MPSSTPWVLGDGLAGHRAGQAEVGDLDRAVVVDDDVLGLDVAVDQALGVRLGERLQHRLEHVEGGPGREQALLAQDVAQGLAGDVLHRQEDAAVVLALVVDTATTLGCDSDALERASRRKRVTKLSSWVRCWRMTFSATSRSSRSSTAR